MKKLFLLLPMLLIVFGCQPAPEQNTEAVDAIVSLTCRYSAYSIVRQKDCSLEKTETIIASLQTGINYLSETDDVIDEDLYEVMSLDTSRIVAAIITIIRPYTKLEEGRFKDLLIIGMESAKLGVMEWREKLNESEDK